MTIAVMEKGETMIERIYRLEIEDGNARVVCTGNVVRCKDCLYYDENERWCRRLGLVGAFDKDDYCAHGEWRSDETD